LHNNARYHLEIMDSPERLIKSLKTLQSETLHFKINESDPQRMPFRFSRREAKLELIVEGEILRDKADTSILNFSGRFAMPPANVRVQRGIVLVLALLAAIAAVQLGYWVLPFPLGFVNVTIFVFGAMALLLAIGAVIWLADFFLVRRAIGRERQAVQAEMVALIEAIYTLVQPVIRHDYSTLDETEGVPMASH
jgi:hypothetical protein